MNNIDLLIITGSPGSGKSSIARALSDHLQLQEVAHAVIELDDLAKIYPRSLTCIMYTNLASIWPNYERLGEIKLIIATYLQAGELEIVKKAAPAKRLTVCEISAPYEELKRRIARREASGSRRKQLLYFVENYSSNHVEAAEVDLKVINQGTHGVSESVSIIIKEIGWPQ